MNVRKILNVLALAAVVSFGFAANANAVSINGNNGHHHGGGNSGNGIGNGGHVPAVPEADTWAMMAVGLGLVGLRLRRKSKNAA
ncbi:MAG: PEP-CTERM sorting domain-containing protein [Sulfuriferula sp.]